MSCSSCGSNSITSCGCVDNCPNKTSDITLFDGNLNYIEVPANATLNQVLQLMENYIITSINDLNLQYTFLAENCIGLPAGTYGYNQVLSAIINTLCSLIAEVEIPTTTNDVDLIDIVYPECIGEFEGVTSTDLFNAILELLCGQKALEILPDTSYNSDDNLKSVAMFILKDIISGMVDNATYVYDHTTVVTNPALLNITVNPMKAVVNSYPVNRENTQVFSLTPSKDIYFLLGDDGVITKIELSIGSPAPSTTGYAYLYKIVTSGVGVASYSEQFTASPFNPPVLSIPNDYIVTAMIHDGEVTSVKLADVVTAATVGDASILSITYNSKGQITATSSLINVSGPVDGDILKYDAGSGGFVNASNLSVGTNGYLPLASGGDFVASSIEEITTYVNISKSVEINNGPLEGYGEAALNVANGTFIAPRFAAGAASLFALINGTIIYVTTTNVTFTSVGFWGVENGAWVKL
jgi:hypothetical protein